jgi:hypothetical protein
MFQAEPQDRVPDLRVKPAQQTDRSRAIACLAIASLTLTPAPVANAFLGHTVTRGNLGVGLTALVAGIELFALRARDS